MNRFALPRMFEESQNSSPGVPEPDDSQSRSDRVDTPVTDDIIDAIAIDGLRVEFSNRVALAPVDLIEEAAAERQPIHVELTRSRR